MDAFNELRRILHDASHSRLITLLCLAFHVLVVQATIGPDTVISGKVVNASNSSPISDANVYATDPNDITQIVSYTMTDDKGLFKLQVNSDKDSLMLIVSGMSIATNKQKVAVRSANYTIRVKEEAKVLKEVIVKADRIFANKDTVNYNVASFVNPNDKSLADVLKKMPGIQVEKSGAISYNGKAVSKMKIEGMDMMKGHYGVATNNLDPNNIATVQVMDNDQDIKALKGLQETDKVNINLKLKASAKGVFNLIADLGAGVESKTDDQKTKAVWDNSLIATYFKRKAQWFATYSTNDVGIDLSSELHTGDNVAPSYTPVLTGIASTTAVGLDRSKYDFNRSHSVTYNNVYRVGKEGELGINAAYYTDRSLLRSSQTMSHLLPDNTYNVVSEDNHHVQHTDAAYGDISYIGNQDKNYLKNQILFNYTRQKTDGSVTSSQPIAENAFMENYRLTDIFSLIGRSSEMRGYNISSKINLEKSPQHLSVLPNLFEKYIDGTSLSQQVHRTNVLFDNSIEWLSAFVIGGLSFHPYVTLTYRRDGLTSALGRLENDLSYSTLDTKLALYINKLTPYWNFYFTLPLNNHYTQLNNRMDAIKQHRNWLLFTPNASVKFTPTSAHDITLKAGIKTTEPNIEQLYTHPLLATYRILSAYQTPTLYEAYSEYGGLEWKWKNVFAMRFLSITLNYTHDSPKVLYGSSYDGTVERYISKEVNEHADNASAGFTLSQGFTWWKSKFTLSGNYFCNESPLLIQDAVERYSSQAMNWGATVYMEPCPAFNILYEGNYGQTWSRLKGGEPVPTMRQMTNTMKLNVSLNKNISFEGDVYQYYNNRNADHQSFVVSSASAKFIIKRIQLTLSCDNIFNRQEYVFTTRSALNTSTASFPIHGRTIMLKIRFRII